MQQYKETHYPKTNKSSAMIVKKKLLEAHRMSEVEGDPADNKARASLISAIPRYVSSSSESKQKKWLRSHTSAIRTAVKSLDKKSLADVVSAA